MAHETVLITGGTGSFGKTMLRDLLAHDIDEVRGLRSLLHKTREGFIS